MTKLAHNLSILASQYDGFVFDQWGVLHDGNVIYPGVLEVFTNLQIAGKPVVILTNSSKSTAVNERRLAERFGINRALYAGLISSADVMIDMLFCDPEELVGRSVSCVYVVADGSDATLVDNSPWRRTSNPEEADLIVLLSVNPQRDISVNLGWITAACSNNVPLICCSADRHTVTSQGVYTGLAAVTSEYERYGGKVINVGKPEPYVYEKCLKVLDTIVRGRVLAVGDQFWSDVVGAKRFGFHAALVGTGAMKVNVSDDKLIEEIFLKEMNQIQNSGEQLPEWFLPSLCW